MSPLLTYPPLELLLAGSVIVLILQILIQAQAFTAEKGNSWTVSPRDGADNGVKGVFQGRVKRALDNYKETYPAFVGLALLLIVLNRTTGLGLIGAEVWAAARIVYIPMYYLGIPYLRSLTWLVSIAGLGLMVAGLFHA